MGPGALSERSRAIVTFALCGFANFELDRHPDGGDRRPRAQPAAGDRGLGLRALLAGSLANLMSAALAGLMI